MRMVRRVLVAGGILLHPVSSRAAQGQEPITIRVGDRLVDGRRVPVGAAQMVGVQRDSGQTEGMQIGSSHDVAVDTSWNGRPAILRVLSVTQRATDKMSAISSLDSVMLDRATLAPLWRRTRTGDRTIAMTFDDGKVHSEVRRGDVIDRSDFENAISVFDNLTVDYVLAALPLDEGARYRVPVYARVANKVSWMNVTVRAAAKMPGSENPVALDITQDGRAFTWFVDARTRHQLGVLMALPGGAEFRVTKRVP